MFDKIKRSFNLARSSWDVLRTDKKLLIFPILSGICCLIVVASFVTPFIALLVVQQKQPEEIPQWVYAVATFAFYFCNYFVIVFFNSALTSCALARFEGQEPTLGGGLHAAWVRLPQILAWALVAATVGMLLKMIENAHEQVGKFISAILGTAWSVITFFVVPVLVVEQVGPIAAVQRSIGILKRTWGEALVGNFGIGLVMFVLAIPIFLLLLVGGVLCASGPALLPVGVLLVVLALVGFVGLAAVSSAMNNIFVAALYRYAAQGQVAAGFDPATFRGAFGPKTA
jgi:hypothetical protein